jgi:two-component system NtrC family sensor kinase
MTDNNQWRVLIIDDEEDIREVLALSLTDAGYIIQTAADGLQGMSACQRFDPHIVITDIRMPQLDGLQVLERTKREHPDVEVIVATAFAEMDLAVKALQLDASDFITKPISDNALMVALQRAQHRHQTRQKLKDYTRFLEQGWTIASRELQEAFEYQRRLIESSMDGILGCDADDLVVTFNNSMEQMSEYGRDDVVGRMKLSRFFDPHSGRQLQEALVGTDYGGPGHLYLYETLMLTRQGTKLPVQISATRLEEHGRVEGLVCFIRDLRQIRRLEQQMAHQARILHQDKMMSLGRLAASVAHEINNPLSGILNYLKLMLRILKRGQTEPTDQSKFERFLETATRETERCSQIVSNLLTFSRASPGTKAPVAVNDLFQRCVVLSRHRLELSGIGLELRLAPEPMAVLGDMNQLQQCVLNLIFNAVDAMPQGGELMLSARPAADAGAIELKVTDNGSGITAEDQARIFEPFFTTKAEGAGVGLGLSTTYGIIERHGGNIQVSSQPGRGTTFTIMLPAVAAGAGTP